MDISDVIEIGTTWQNLGWAVQEQIGDLISGDAEPGSLNENAVEMAERFANRLKNSFEIEGADDLLEEIANYRAATRGEED